MKSERKRGSVNDAQKLALMAAVYADTLDLLLSHPEMKYLRYLAIRHAYNTGISSQRIANALGVVQNGGK